MNVVIAVATVGKVKCSQSNKYEYFSATLCSSNILDEHKVANVGDFGLAKAMPRVMGGVTRAAYGGSWGYQAPEILEGDISPKFDAYRLDFSVVRKVFHYTAMINCIHVMIHLGDFRSLLET